MTDREDRDVDDLFGDLDEFFAPIDEVDWPEGAQGDRAEGEEEQRQEVAPAIDLTEEEEPEGEPEPPEPAAEEPAASEVEEPPDASRVDEATAEMSGEEWEGLRSALDEEESPLESPGPQEPEEGEPELTAEDLARPPPQYTGLPGREQQEEAPEDGDPFVEPVLAEEALFEAEEALPPVVEAGAEEPLEATSEDVEAAAQHFAGGIEPEEVERDLLSDLEEQEVEEQEVPTGAVEEAEPLAGEGPPTWQEPAAYAIEDEAIPEEEVPPPPGGRNLPAAAATGVILAIAAIALLAIGPGPFVVLAIALVTLGQGEFYAALKARGFQPATAIGLIAGVLTMAGAYVHGSVPGQGEAAVLFGLTLGLVLTVPWYMAASPGARKGLVTNAGVTVLGIVYGPVLVSFALILLALPEVGTSVFLTVVGLAVLYDICAYAIGTLWGDRPLAPTISPRKSWEGAIGATFVLLLVAFSIVPMIDPFNVPRAIGLALVVAVAAPLGDLVESAIKRDLGIKDMGTLLPGHGGVLDRIDAILFAAPAAYYFLRLVA